MTDTEERTTTGFVPGTRVEVTPWCREWTYGDTFGTVVGICTLGVTIDHEKSGKRRRYDPRHLAVV